MTYKHMTFIKSSSCGGSVFSVALPREQKSDGNVIFIFLSVKCENDFAIKNGPLYWALHSRKKLDDGSSCYVYFANAKTGVCVEQVIFTGLFESAEAWAVVVSGEVAK